MALPRYVKHPSDIISVPINVINLGSNTIGVVSGASTPSGLTISSVTADGSTVTALIGSGVSGTLYQVEITVNISNGERRIKEFELMVTDN